MLLHVCVYVHSLSLTHTCTHTLSLDLLLPLFRLLKRNTEQKKEALSALCSVTCLCPLVRIVWNRFYWKSLFIFLCWKEEYWSLLHNSYQTAKSTKERLRVAWQNVSDNSYFFYQLGCWFNILKKALNTSLFIASVRALPLGCLSHGVLPGSLEA